MLLSWALAAPLRAQEPSARDRAAARRLFQEGRTAASEGRWDDALESLSRSYSLVPVAGTLMSLAGAEQHAGRLVIALEHYRRFLHEAPPEQLRRYSVAVREQIEALEARVAYLQLVVAQWSAGLEMRLDGEPLSPALRGVAFPVDPGTHTVAVLRDGESVWDARVALHEGERKSVEIALEAEENDASPPLGQAHEPERDGASTMDPPDDAAPPSTESRETTTSRPVPTPSEAARFAGTTDSVVHDEPASSRVRRRRRWIVAVAVAVVAVAAASVALGLTLGGEDQLMGPDV